MLTGHPERRFEVDLSNTEIRYETLLLFCKLFSLFFTANLYLQRSRSRTLSL
jgi:hypothetical protein